VDIALLINLLVFSIFISSGTSKIFNFQSFINAIHIFSGIRNTIYRILLSSFIILIELVCSILILVPRYSFFASIAFIVLLLIFNIVIIKHLKNKTYISCHCGGILGNEIINKKLPVRNFFLITALVYGLIYPSSIGINDIIRDIVNFKTWIVSYLIVGLILFIYKFIDIANSMMDDKNITQE
jgi:uncharacterized membrane protein YphA (DoxX/SURF4 family)